MADDMVEVPRSTLADLELASEQLAEATSEAERALRLDEMGWATFGAREGEPISEQAIKDRAGQARVMAVADPLIRRGVNLRAAYVWGVGPRVSADDPDVDEVVQTFLREQEDSFHGAPARVQRERTFATDGTLVLALPTDPLTGAVQVRRVPVADVVGFITNPDDAADVWFVRRKATSSRMVLTPGRDGTVTANTRAQEWHTYHPVVGLTYSSTKPTTINGDTVDWDTPVLIQRVNEVDGVQYGIPDVWAALPWARGYKGFLEDWARLTKALSKFAFQATGKGSRAGQTRSALATATAYDSPVGQTVITSEGQRFEAIGKSGATIDANSGRPLAAMVAAALDIPVTMLLADPGVTGARATAETLDRPLEEVLGQRREVHATVYRRVLDWVIQSAMRAPRGPLTGRKSWDPVTGRERWVLSGTPADGHPLDTVGVEFPPIDKPDLAVLMTAIKQADDMGKLPPLEVAKLIVQAFDLDNADDVIDQLTDEEGEWVDPVDAARARSQTDGVYQGLAPGQPPVPPQQQAPQPPAPPVGG